MVAVDSNSPEMVKLLLKYKNIKLDVKCKDGDSLMHRCVGSKEEVCSDVIYYFLANAWESAPRHKLKENQEPDLQY